jgi:hypothetical protein
MPYHADMSLLHFKGFAVFFGFFWGGFRKWLKLVKWFIMDISLCCCAAYKPLLNGESALQYKRTTLLQLIACR